MIVNATLNNQYYILKNSIETTIEYCKKTIGKIKTSIKKENRYEFLEKVNDKMTNIFKILFENEELFENEIECLTLIKPYIVYIVGKNCEIHNFGHINHTITLLNIFNDLIDAKFQSLYDKSKKDYYESVLNNYPLKLNEFEKIFYETIFINNHEFDEDIKKLDKKLRNG